MLDFLIDIDTRLFLALNELHLPFFDYFMKVFTGKVIWVPMYAMILFILYRRFGWRVATVYVVGIVLIIALTDQLCASCIRPFVERLRPANPENPIHTDVHVVDGYRGGAYGFPSCHAANSFALATICTLLFAARRFTVFIFTWAVINSYSRLYLGVHYPGDLIFGAIVGSAIAVAVYYLANALAKRISCQDKYYLNDSRGNIAIGGATISYHLSDIMIFVGCTTSFVILMYSFIAWI